jgi:hypothetical protein
LSKWAAPHSDFADHSGKSSPSESHESRQERQALVLSVFSLVEGKEVATVEPKQAVVSGALLCAGIQKVRSRTTEPLLCLVKQQKITLVAVSSIRLVISWEARLSQAASGNLTLLLPPVIADWLSCETVCSQAGIVLATRGQSAIARLADHMGTYDLHWRSDLTSLSAPRELSQLLQVPAEIVRVPHLSFSDAAHQAVAKLGCMHASRQISPTKLAMLVDLNFGRLRVDGEVIVTTDSRRYFFDPRLVIRAMEFLKEEAIGVGITPLRGDERRGCLSLLCTDGDWNVHCALLSIGRDTQKLYPLPPVLTP